MHEPEVSGIVAILMLLFLFFTYFLPTIVSIIRGTQHKGFIFLINILFGWTGIAWLGLFIWAAVETPSKISDMFTKIEEPIELTDLVEEDDS
jgi:hypothetical protein